MLYDVPLLTQQKYLDCLSRNKQHIYSCYFSLDLEPVLDNRYRFSTANRSELVSSLSRFPDIKKYALLNSRFYSHKQYEKAQLVKYVIPTLRFLVENNLLNGIVYSDHYFLQAISDANSSIAQQLEAVPSVNCMLDSFDKIKSQFLYIEKTAFNLPGKIVLDRSLNRKQGALEIISKQCRSQYPELKLALLGNEGCLFHCPFKLSHDAHIAFCNMGDSHDSTFCLNTDLGCKRILHEKPELVFQSPFIRPENVDSYNEYVHIIKLCGRTLGGDFLEKVVSAYCQQKFQGNLLELMDTLEWLEGRLYVDNEKLPDDFLKKLNSCENTCEKCSYCKNLIKEYTWKQECTIKDFRKK